MKDDILEGKHLRILLAHRSNRQNLQDPDSERDLPSYLPKPARNPTANRLRASQPITRERRADLEPERLSLNTEDLHPLHEFPDGRGRIDEEGKREMMGELDGERQGKGVNVNEEGSVHGL
jgi:hypothetical protein